MADERLLSPLPRPSGAAPLDSAPRTALPTLAATVAAVAILYFARDVFLPLAVAILLTFALAPIVARLRRLGLSRVPAVLLATFAAFLVVASFAYVVGTQVSEVAQNVPTFQSNILAKIRTLKEAGGEGGVIERLGAAVDRIGKEIGRPERPAIATEEPQAEREPLLVEIFSPQRPVEVLRELVTPLVGPLATAGLVIVVVIFMLLEREDLRDRFIRLAGYGDLHRTTEALQDAGKRVGQYLLMQLVVNVTYGVPVAIGLWVLGVPNAILWGLLAIVLRFVPYIGPAIAMAFPLFLAFAVAPGWALVLWVAALFVAVELISNNVVEPWLYGSRTGLSSLAIIVAAIFWTWLWGPLGLVLSTPLTVCLVVLGKHVPQFAFLEVLFGNEPVLDPKARLYQRLLAGAPDEATDQAEELLEEQGLAEFYGTVAVPALLMAEWDRARGALAPEQVQRIAASAATLLENLSDYAEATGSTAPGNAGSAPNTDAEAGAQAGTPRAAILVVGGRGELDVVAARMLAQVIEAQGGRAEVAAALDVMPARMRQLPLTGIDTAVIGFLSRSALTHGRFMVRRLKRAKPDLRVGVVVWPGEAGGGEDREHLRARLAADFIAFDLDGALAALGPAARDRAA